MLNQEQLNKLAPIVKNKIVWDSLIYLLDIEKEQLVNLLQTQQNTENLIRINGKLEFINNLKQYRRKTGDEK